MKHQTRIRVRFSDMDSNGHVNNAVFASYMEESRVQFARDVLGDEPIRLILASLHLNYRAQAHYPENAEIIATTWISRIGNSSFEFFCEIRSLEGVLLCDGTAVTVHFDYDSQRPMPLPEKLRSLLSQYSETEAM
jgi:acyl-CoA thioester hydrolase